MKMDDHLLETYHHGCNPVPTATEISIYKSIIVGVWQPKRDTYYIVTRGGWNVPVDEETFLRALRYLRE